MDILRLIKRLVLRGSIRFTEKAREEMELDGLLQSDVVESIANAQAIDKTVRSRSRLRRSSHEKLYIIKSFNYEGTLIYTKGTVVRRDGEEIFYVFISSKIATLGE